MSNGNHFTSGIPLAGIPSFTGSDVDTVSSALRLAADRGLVFIGDTEPDSTTTPDWERLLWAKPFVDNGVVKYELKMYNSGDATWYNVTTSYPDLALSDLKAVAADVNKVAVVTQIGSNYIPTWTTFTPSNIPATAITPGTANQFLTTDSGGNVSVWRSLSSALAQIGRVVSIDNLTFGTATAGQVPTFTGGTIKWQTPYTPPDPAVSALAWSSSTNNLEVWDSSVSKTVLKSRKQFVDTVPNDVSAGSISGTDKTLLWSSATSYTATIAELGAAMIAASAVPALYATPAGSEIAVPAQGITATAAPHGLGVIPKSFGASLLCILDDTASGYVAGDCVQIVNTWDSSNDNRQQFFVRVDATNMYVQRLPQGGGANIYLPNKSTGAITNASSDTHFKIRLWAMA